MPSDFDNLTEVERTIIKHKALLVGHNASEGADRITAKTGISRWRIVKDLGRLRARGLIELSVVSLNRKGLDGKHWWQVEKNKAVARAERRKLMGFADEAKPKPVEVFRMPTPAEIAEESVTTFRGGEFPWSGRTFEPRRRDARA